VGVTRGTKDGGSIPSSLQGTFSAITSHSVHLTNERESTSVGSSCRFLLYSIKFKQHVAWGGLAV
jgi:hypothetical protein